MLQTAASLPVSLKTLGDQPRLSESKHAQRARFHQSWYRAACLGVPNWGHTPLGRPLGSILPTEAAAIGKNFTSPESEMLFLQRRTQGWGVDPLRMSSHMTSSQTLLMNLLGPLGANQQWLLEVLRATIDRPDFTKVSSAEVEFAPAARSKYLGDMTRVDAFFVVEVEGGEAEGIVLELKYTDRFSARRLPLAENSRYRDLADSTGLWRNSSSAFAEAPVNQLLRCHALGVRTLQVDYGATLPVTILLIDHPHDLGATAVFESYRRHLTNPTQARHVRLDQFLATSAATAPGRSEEGTVAELALRYLAHEESETFWQEHLALR